MRQEYLWALITLVIAIVLAYILITITKDVQSEAAYCLDDKTRDELRQLTLESIDISYKAHVSKLFEVWVRDPAEQPKRAKVGLQSGITAYLRARSDALKWEPPSC
jgi:hypothetical protein